MLTLDVSGLAERLVLGVQRQARRADGTTDNAQEVRDGLRVSLSELGRVRAAAQHDDIDEADLPDNVKEILKLIRALRQQIAEKQAELQALMAQEGLGPPLRQARAEALRSELSALQGALGMAGASLAAALKDQRLSDGQRMQASRLAVA